MKKILLLLGWLWVLPVNILAWVFWFFPQYLRGVFKKIRFHSNGVIAWDVDNSSKFFKGLKEKHWWGFVIGSNIVFVDCDMAAPKDAQKLKHEVAHVYQNYRFGMFFYPLYILMTVYLWLFKKNKHSYLDNPFERQARKEAGQQVTIPKSEWSRYYKDRWPWW
jgi:hypothetical protein